MFGFLTRKKSILIDEILSADLHSIADIHASSFVQAWGDGAIAGMLKTKGMCGLKASVTGHRGPGGFLIYRVAGVEAEIITIATKPQLRGSGLAQALLDRMIQDCLRDRLQEIFLEVDEHNQAAIGLYRTRGFKKVGLRKAYYRANTKELATNSIAANSNHDHEDQGNAVIMRLDLMED